MVTRQGQFRKKRVHLIIILKIGRGGKEESSTPYKDAPRELMIMVCNIQGRARFYLSDQKESTLEQLKRKRKAMSRTLKSGVYEKERKHSSHPFRS